MIVSISFDTEAMPRLNPQQREQAIGRLHAGQPARVIANDFNCNVRTIERLRVRYNATNSTNDRPRCGRPQVTTARQNRLMVRQHLRNRFTRATETARQTVGTHQRPISADTVRHRLVASNLRCYRPARGPVLTPRHRQERLQWALQRQNWRNQQWRNVIFSDESRYCISTADGRTRLWRRRGERYDDNCMMERNAWGGPSIMVWGGIGLNVKLGPVIFQNLGPGRGNGVTAARYIDQVLRPHVVPHFARHQNKTFQQDNARAHTARATRDFLQQNNVNVMNWPALSPDLNPIEHLWDEIQRRLNEEQPSPTTAAELSVAFQRVWARIPIAFINRLVNSMYRRCAIVINTGGGHTRY